MNPIQILIIVVIVIILTACSQSVETKIKGDREIVQVTAGLLKDGNGNSRDFFVVRDKDTSVDYLVVIDAGIVQLQPRPAAQVER